MLTFSLFKARTALAINNFEACAAAGYPVTASHPRQCITPEDRTFIEESSQPTQPVPIGISEACRSNLDCTTGFVCRSGLCVEAGSAGKPPQEEVVCTLDAKLCPDGSAVGRTGPNCEFAPCPGEN